MSKANKTVFEFRSESAQKLFDTHGWNSFDDLWNQQLPWFEEPNQRRSGWSGVSRLTAPVNDLPNVFIKKQENHNCKSLFHPISGVPTYFREFLNLKRLAKNQIPSLEVVYMGWRKFQGKDQAVLITKALDGYSDLESYLASCNDEQRAIVLSDLAVSIAMLHRRAFRYNALYGKHVFVAQDEKASPRVRLIDAEGMRKGFPRFLVAANDLEKLFRRTKGLNSTDQERFMQRYLNLLNIVGNKRISSIIEKRRQRKSI